MFQLRPDQIEDLGACIKNPRWMLLHDPGVGKTPIACLYTWWMWDRHKKKTVWVQPLAIVKKNRDEIIRFTEFKPDDVVVVTGTPKQRQALYDRKAKVYLMGADTFGREWQALLKANPEIDLLIGDEWHMMYSSMLSQRTNALCQAMRHITRLCPMTGTLVRGRLNSVYPAIHLIEPRYYASHDAFMNMHALLDNYGRPYMWLNTERISTILKKHGSRRSFKEIYGDVDAVFQTQRVSMSGSQASAYKEFEEKAILELEDAFLDGTVPGVNLIRAREILSSPEKFNLLKKGESTERDDLLEIHLNDHLAECAPLIIGTASRFEQARIVKLCQKVGLPVGLMNGDTSQKQRGVLDQEFRDGVIQVMVVSPQVGSIGFNWGHCDHGIFLHLDYYADNWEQLWKRMTRGLRSRPLLVQTIIYGNTVEEAVLGVLEQKFALSNKVDSTKDAVSFRAKPKPTEKPLGPDYSKLAPLPQKRA